MRPLLAALTLAGLTLTGCAHKKAAAAPAATAADRKLAPRDEVAPEGTESKASDDAPAPGSGKDDKDGAKSDPCMGGD
jgi:hypothetical protein